MSNGNKEKQVIGRCKSCGKVLYEGNIVYFSSQSLSKSNTYTYKNNKKSIWCSEKCFNKDYGRYVA